MDSQPEFFEELPSAKSPGRHLEYRAGKKIIQIPYSIWKDGRMRADLSKYGVREVVSRNSVNLQDRVVERLREYFGAIVEAVCDEFARAGQPKAVRPRSSNKLSAMPRASGPKRYINPFSEKKWTFGKCPDWLLTRREPTAIEKHVYGKLLYPLLVCERWDQTSGVIFGLNQAKLAKALGLPRQSVNVAMTSLRCRRLIECMGRPGAQLVVRFLWHEWIEQTCQVNGQVKMSPPGTITDRTYPASGQGAVMRTDTSCQEDGQLPKAVEKREYRREERKNSSPPIW